MKKIYYLAAALTVLAGSASCNKNTDVQKPGELGETIPFTVTANQGNQKTSMIEGVLSWTAGDNMTIVETNGAHATQLTLTDGAGTASGTFEGAISTEVQDKANLYGLYNATYNSGNFAVTVPASQAYNATSFEPGIYPSIGTGTYNKGGSTAITLSNPMGVLRIKLTGTVSVKQVKITAASSNIAGNFSVTPALAVSGGSGKSVTISCSPAVTLTNDGVYFNFVTAPFSSQKVTVEVTKGDDNKYSEDITVAVSASSATKPAAIEVPAVVPTTGTAKATIGGNQVDVAWVQLWSDGPKWAVYNVGASSETGAGQFFAWGYADGYTWTGSEWNPAASFTSTGFPDYQTHVFSDMATANWGSNWRLPTKAEYEALISNTTKTFIESGNLGLRVTGTGDVYGSNSIFFPAPGKINPAGTGFTVCGQGYYWISTPYAEGYGGDEQWGYNLTVHVLQGTPPANNVYRGNSKKYIGCMVRAVLK